MDNIYIGYHKVISKVQLCKVLYMLYRNEGGERVEHFRILSVSVMCFDDYHLMINLLNGTFFLTDYDSFVFRNYV